MTTDRSETPHWASLAEHIKRVGNGLNFRVRLQGGDWTTVSSAVTDTEPTVAFGHDAAVCILEQLAQSAHREQVAEARVAALQAKAEDLTRHAEALAKGWTIVSHHKPAAVVAYDQWKAEQEGNS